MIHSLSVVNTIKFKHKVSTKPVVLSVKNVLYFSQTIKHNIRTRTVTNHLNIKQGVFYRRSIAYLSVGHTLNLHQIVAKNPIYQEVTNYLHLMQSIQRPKTGTVTHRLNLVQNVDVSRSIVVSDILTLQQTVRYNVVRNFNIAHTLILYNGVSAWLTNPDFIYNRPVFTIQERVRFRYKSTDILLRKPDFDDTYRYEFTRIDRRSRGGDILISRDPIWPDNKTFKIAFSYLNEEEINKLHAFMEESLGKTIRYLNYDSVEWEGYITNPQTESAQVGRANYSIAIEFQGEPLP